jgi:dipeptidyl aminopeptidase/acylaminoacyl peptidase
MIARIPALILAAALAAAPAFGASPPPAAKDLAVVFRPYRTEQVALAPDGRHLACTVRDVPVLWLSLVDIERPENKATVIVGRDEVTGFFSRTLVRRARVTFLRWATPTRLVYAINVPDPKHRNGVRHEVRAVDVDGRNDRKLVDADDLEELIQPPIRMPSRDAPPDAEISVPPPIPRPRQPRVLGLARDDPTTVFVEAAGRTNEVFKVDIHTGKFTSLGGADRDGRLLCDWQGRPRLLETPAIYRSSEGGRPVSTLPAPQEFEWRPLPDRDSWQNLDKLLGAQLGLRFRHAAEEFYRPRAIPLAFDADPNILYFASNVGRDTFGIYALDLAARRRTDFAVEVPDCDLAGPGDVFGTGALVFDRRHRLAGVRLPGQTPGTHWLDPELARAQTALDAAFAGRNVAIVEWDEARKRFLVLVTGRSDPGRYYIYDDGSPGRLLEFTRRAPWLPAEKLNLATPFAFDTPAGVHLTGSVTVPAQHLVALPPLVLLCHDLPGGRAELGFVREIEALGDLGFVVVQVNYRGSAGIGLRHRDAVRAGFDRIPLEDLRATVDWLAGRHRFDRRRVALVGQRFGGYLAVRALQLFPKEFRCAVCIDAPLDPARWLNESTLPLNQMGMGRGGMGRGGMGGMGSFDSRPDLVLERRRAFFDVGSAALTALSVTRQPELLTRPVFIIQDGESRLVWPSQGTNLRDALRKLGREVEFLEVTAEYAADDATTARAKVFARIGEFLTAHLYDFRVDIGEVKEDRR